MIYHILFFDYKFELDASKYLLTFFITFRILKLGVNLLVFLFLILMYNSSDGKLFNR